jgi:hypothetical protein
MSGGTMATLYTRRFDLKDSLTEQQVIDCWRLVVEEFIPTTVSVK